MTIIEHYRQRENSVEEARIEIYLARACWVEDTTEVLWGSKVSPSIISEMSKKAYIQVKEGTPDFLCKCDFSRDMKTADKE